MAAAGRRDSAAAECCTVGLGRGAVGQRGQSVRRVRPCERDDTEALMMGSQDDSVVVVVVVVIPRRDGLQVGIHIHTYGSFEGV
jgi:hypothetical protein